MLAFQRTSCRPSWRHLLHIRYSVSCCVCVCAPLMVLGRTPNASLSGCLFILFEHLWNASFCACMWWVCMCGVHACLCVHACVCVCSVPTPLYDMTCAYSQTLLHRYFCHLLCLTLCDILPLGLLFARQQKTQSA